MSMSRIVRNTSAIVFLAAAMLATAPTVRAWECPYVPLTWSLDPHSGDFDECNASALSMASGNGPAGTACEATCETGCGVGWDSAHFGTESLWYANGCTWDDGSGTVYCICDGTVIG